MSAGRPDPFVPRVAVHHGPDGRPALFEGGTVQGACAPRGVMGTLRAMDEARAQGLWVAGWIAYEAAAAFEPRLSRIAPQVSSLVCLGAFPPPRPLDGPLDAPAAIAGSGGLLSPPRPAVTRAAYGRAFARLQGLIAAGDCYQVNLTFPLRARLAPGVRPARLWDALRAAPPGGRPAAHAAFAEMSTDGPTVASLSPELFVRVDAHGRIEARPMKGTAPRDPDPARDAALAAALHASPKARAENLMIVDLLRNDIARLSRPGSVRVPDLYRIESYPTVHQMTSTVTGELAAPASLSTLLPALFPCGSVTGAPKIRAMEIIRELEPHPRGVYCGAVGWMAPDGRADWSVAIRTLSIEGRDVTVGVGGGVVADSTADGEWEEALWKARFLAPAIPGWAGLAPKPAVPPA